MVLPKFFRGRTTVSIPFFIHVTFCLTTYLPIEYLLHLGSTTGPVIVFCGQGGRAKCAKAKLESLGYSKVFNAGGLLDVDFLD